MSAAGGGVLLLAFAQAHELAAVAGLALLLIALVLERALRDRRRAYTDQLFRDFYQEAAIGIYRSSADGVPIFANKAFVRMMGYEDEKTWLAAAVDIALDWYVDPSRRADFKNEIEKTGSVTNFVSQIYRHATREVIWVSETARVVRDQRGRTRYYEGTIEDITARVEAEEQLKRAKATAENVARMKAEFLANMSHELRTPLNGVLGMAELLSGTGLDGRQSQYVEVLLRSGETLMCVINDVLDLSKAEAGRIVLETAPIDLRQICEDVACLLAPNALKKGLEFALYAPLEAEPGVIGDHHRVRQILLNLVGNAIKFTETGHIVMRLDARRAGPNIDVVLSVEDTGVGISASDQARIFGQFEQVDASSTRAKGGTGLGLAISQTLARMMGGDIKLRSEIGEGSTFSFEVSLPAANAKTIDWKTRRTPYKRVLVIDCCEPTRALIADFARGFGAEATAVATVEEACAMIGASFEFDIAFIDGGRDCKDAAAIREKLAQNPSVTIKRWVLISRIHEASNVALMGVSGFDARLVKPLRSAEVMAQLLPESAAAVASGRTMDDPEAPSGAAVQGTLAGVRVLLAEDNLVNRMVVRSMLANLGLTLEEVGDGRQAVEAAKNTRFDAILMDVSMPEMDGVDATREIRRLEAVGGWASAPIIGLTAHVLDDQRSICLAAGMDDYLTKPVKRDQLIEALTRRNRRAQAA